MKTHGRAADERWYEKDWAALLWPLGGTLFGLIVVPVAIAQYPRFFNENEWLLPASVVVVVFCWCFPLLLHKRARRFYSDISAHGAGGKLALAVISIIVVGLLYIGAKRLLASHKAHLSALNAPKVAEQLTAQQHSITPGIGETLTEQPKAVKSRPKRAAPRTYWGTNQTRAQVLELSDRVKKIGDDLDNRIESINKKAEDDRRHITNPDEFKQHFEPFIEMEMQQAHQRARSAYQDCCHMKAQELQKTFGDATDTTTEAFFDNPSNPGGYWRVADDLKQIAQQIPDRP